MNVSDVREDAAANIEVPPVSSSLLLLIVHRDGAQKNRKPKANSISPRQKRKLYTNFCYECLISEILCE
jgi:hypothetical protein